MCMCGKSNIEVQGVIKIIWYVVSAYKLGVFISLIFCENTWAGAMIIVFLGLQIRRLVFSHFRKKK